MISHVFKQYVVGRINLVIYAIKSIVNFLIQKVESGVDFLVQVVES